MFCLNKSSNNQSSLFWMNIRHINATKYQTIESVQLNAICQGKARIKPNKINALKGVSGEMFWPPFWKNE